MPENEKKTEEQAKDESKTDETKDESTDSSKEESKTDETKDESKNDESKDESKEKEEELGEDVPAPVLREKVTKANAEAANYRTKLREAEEKLKNAKSPEEVDQIVQQMTKDREESEHALLVENVALKFKLPEKAQKRLAGKTREELEADAKELAELFGADEDDEDIDLEGGLNPRKRGEEADDPRSLAKKYGARRRR